MDLFSAGAVLAVVGSLLYKGLTGHTHFAPGACDRLEPYLTHHIVGQDLALRQLINAVCDHLEDPAPSKPLVLSAHGPPGVGKSLSHFLLARALYSKRPQDVQACPGAQCPGYKVMYGIDYTADQRHKQHTLLREAILAHVAAAPESLLVVEEYDKLDCESRALFRQLLENPQVANVSMARSIVLLESNTGYTQLHQLLNKAPRRDAITAEDASRAIKDLIFSQWLAAGCESRTDTTKLLNLVDFYLPYFPLERAHIEALCERLLEARAASEGPLSWDPRLPAFLAGRVDYEGGYPIEGAKEVRAVMTRYVSTALRAWARDHELVEGTRVHLAPPRGPLDTELRVTVVVT